MLSYPTRDAAELRSRSGPDREPDPKSGSVPGSAHGVAVTVGSLRLESVGHISAKTPSPLLFFLFFPSPHLSLPLWSLALSALTSSLSFCVSTSPSLCSAYLVSPCLVPFPMSLWSSSFSLVKELNTPKISRRLQDRRVMSVLRLPTLSLHCLMVRNHCCGPADASSAC